MSYCAYSQIKEIKADKASRYELYVREEGENDDIPSQDIEGDSPENGDAT